MNREECSVRIHLADEYSRLITEFNTLLESLKQPHAKRSGEIWAAAELARKLSESAWKALEKHITDHQCVDLHWAPPTPSEPDDSNRILAMAALAALDIILVANDDRRYVDVNEAAAAVLGLPRSEIIGRRIDEFFSIASGETIPQTWAGFIAEGVLSGICELNAPGKKRRFAYRAKANFAPGLHLSVLRELTDDEA